MLITSTAVKTHLAFHSGSGNFVRTGIAPAALSKVSQQGNLKINRLLHVFLHVVNCVWIGLDWIFAIGFSVAQVCVVHRVGGGCNSRTLESWLVAVVKVESGMQANSTLAFCALSFYEGLYCLTLQAALPWTWRKASADLSNLLSHPAGGTVSFGSDPSEEGGRAAGPVKGTGASAEITTDTGGAACTLPSSLLRSCGGLCLKLGKRKWAKSSIYHLREMQMIKHNVFSSSNTRAGHGFGAEESGWQEVKVRHLHSKVVSLLLQELDQALHYGVHVQSINDIMLSRANFSLILLLEEVFWCITQDLGRCL